MQVNALIILCTAVATRAMPMSHLLLRKRAQIGEPCEVSDGRKGTCKDLHSADGCLGPVFTAVAGHCPGPRHHQCCVRTNDGISSSHLSSSHHDPTSTGLNLPFHGENFFDNIGHSGHIHDTPGSSASSQHVLTPSSDLTSSTGSTTSGDVEVGFNSACSLRPPLTERIIGQSHKAAGIWNMYGGYLKEQADKIGGVPMEAMVAVLLIESGGKGIDKNTGKPVTRFENHIFSDQLKKLGLFDQAKFNQHFTYNSGERWKGHTFNGESFHGSQSKENEVLEFAKTISTEAAYRSASYGLPQVMGFNYALLGYDSAATMAAAFESSIKSQLDGFFAFIQNSKKSCSKHGHSDKRSALHWLQQSPPDYIKFACNYNGSGQAGNYGKLIQAAADAFKTFVKSDATASILTSGTSCTARGKTGICGDDALCDGRAEPGFCAGANNMKCCLKCA